MKLKNVKIRTKLVFLFILAALIPVIAIGWISGNLAEKALLKTTFAQLEAVREIKKNQIESFFSERLGDVKVLANNPYTHQAFDSLNDAMKESGSLKT